MTWLKKYGLAVLKFIGQVVGVLPQYLSSATATGTTLGDTLAKIGQAVATAEVMIGALSDPNAKTGADKLRAATPIVAQLVQTSELLTGKKIANEALFIQGCTKITDGTADVLNSLKADVEVVSTT